MTKGTSRETLQRGADFARWLADNDVRVILLDRNNKLARRVSSFKSSRAQEHAVIDAKNLVKGLQSDEELTSETPPFLLGKVRVRVRVWVRVRARMRGAGAAAARWLARPRDQP